MTELRERMVVVGAGTMGHGIAQVSAMKGMEVVLVDRNEEVLKKALDAVRANLEKGVKRGKVEASVRDEALTLISTTTDLEGACTGARWAVEAVPEKLEIKKAIFEQLDQYMPHNAYIASNTSSMSITQLGSFMSRPERLIGLHFFNPVHIMKLLEIVVGHLTSDATLDAARTLGERLGKTTITVRDMPGFATSRLGIATGMEAIRMVEEGVASAQDIDTAMELGYRWPMGPLKLTDLVGLDVRLAITEHLYHELGTDTFRPPQLLKQLVRAGKLGKKSGQGFYSWED